jgi:hypothetical protein
MTQRRRIRPIIRSRFRPTREAKESFLNITPLTNIENPKRKKRTKNEEE